MFFGRKKGVLHGVPCAHVLAMQIDAEDAATTAELLSVTRSGGWDAFYLIRK